MHVVRESPVPQKTVHRTDFWHILDVVSSALLLGIALANSIRLWQGFVTGNSTPLQVASYWLLPVGFELAKNCFFASGVHAAQARRGRLSAALFLAAFFFSSFSLAGSALSLLAEASAEGEVAVQAQRLSDDRAAELAALPAAIARQDRILDTYDQSYRDYAQVVAAATAEKARLEARRDALRAEAAPANASAARPLANPFYAIVKAFGARTEDAALTAARLRLVFMSGITLGIEYGGLFLLALALTGAKRRPGQAVGRTYVYSAPLRVNHIAAPGAAPGRSETLCGKVFGLEPQTTRGEGPICPECLAKECLDA